MSVDARLRSTSHGLQGVVNDTAGLYVQDDSPQDDSHYRVRFHFDPNGFDPGEAQGHLRVRLLVAFQEDPTRRVAALVLRRQSGAYSLMARSRLDDNAQADTGFFPITDAPHSVEIEWKRSTGIGHNNGSLRLWIDGSVQATLFGLRQQRQRRGLRPGGCHEREGGSIRYPLLGRVRLPALELHRPLNRQPTRSRRAAPWWSPAPRP